MCVLFAEAMAQARAHAGPGSPEAERVFAVVSEALSDVLQSDASPSERCAALEALLWAQVKTWMHLSSPRSMGS